MSDNVLPFPAVPRRPTPLADQMRSMAFQARLQGDGSEATHIFLPRRSLRTVVKPFIEALVAEEPEIVDGPAKFRAARVFDLIVNEGAECAFAGLIIEMYDGEDLIVGGKNALEM